ACRRTSAPAAAVCCDSCVAELHLVQAAVDPVLGQQLGVGPLLHQFAVFQHQHLVGVLDGGQAMGDDQRGAVRHQVRQRVLHQAFGFVVQRGGGLVQDQH